MAVQIEKKTVSYSELTVTISMDEIREMICEALERQQGLKARPDDVLFVGTHDVEDWNELHVEHVEIKVLKKSRGPRKPKQSVGEDPPRDDDDLPSPPKKPGRPRKVVAEDEGD